MCAAVWESGQPGGGGGRVVGVSAHYFGDRQGYVDLKVFNIYRRKIFTVSTICVVRWKNETPLNEDDGGISKAPTGTRLTIPRRKSLATSSRL
jgi:hypothetical protein